MQLKTILYGELGKIKDKPTLDKRVYRQFLKRIKQNKGLIRAENPADHFSCYFLPINLETKSFFLGYHKKAGGWIPPGGHMEKGEHPVETVKREMREELEYKPKDSQIEFFDISLTPIANVSDLSKFHYDLWYAVFTPKISFHFDRREFFEAGWFAFSEAIGKMFTPQYQSILSSFVHSLPVR